MYQLPILRAAFNLPLRRRELPRWRGAFVEMIGRDHALFHNHAGEAGLHYRYPRIQYRVWRGQAGLLALDEGIDSLQAAISEQEWHLRWDGAQHPLQLISSQRETFVLRLSEQPQRYRLHRWLALNQPQYVRWREMTRLQDRIALLEARLSQQLASMAQDLGWPLPEPPAVQIEDLLGTQRLRLHRNPMLAFDVVYRTHLTLPDDLGLGKGVAHGFGWQQSLGGSATELR